MTRGGYLLLVWSVSSKLWWCTLVIEMQECKLAYLQHACYVFAVDIKQKKKPCSQPITGQVTEVTCPVIGRAQPELTPSQRQKMGLGLNNQGHKAHCINRTMETVGFTRSVIVVLPEIVVLQLVWDLFHWFYMRFLYKPNEISFCSFFFFWSCLVKSLHIIRRQYCHE